MRILRVQHVSAILPVFVGLAALVAGCSDQPKDDWYERSAAATAEEKQYVEVQKSLGLSESEAKAHYAGRLFWDATEGRDKKIVLDKKDMEVGNPGREVPR